MMDDTDKGLNVKGSRSTTPIAIMPRILEGNENRQLEAKIRVWVEDSSRLLTAGKNKQHQVVKLNQPSSIHEYERSYID